MLAGLKLDDIRNEWHPDVQTALSRLTPEELSNRNKRLKRAMDLSLKHSELNKEAQAAVQPLIGYLPLERAREERLERYHFLFCRMSFSVCLVVRSRTQCVSSRVCQTPEKWLHVIDRRQRRAVTVGGGDAGSIYEEVIV